MPRAINNVASRKRRKKVLKAAKGYWGARSRLYLTAQETIKRGLAYAYRDRRQRKRQFRRLWIARINAATRLNGMSYNSFICGLKAAEVDIDRKVLAAIAVDDPSGFSKIVEIAKGALSEADKG